MKYENKKRTMAAKMADDMLTNLGEVQNVDKPIQAKKQGAACGSCGSVHALGVMCENIARPLLEPLVKKAGNPLLDLAGAGVGAVGDAVNLAGTAFKEGSAIGKEAANPGGGAKVIGVGQDAATGTIGGITGRTQSGLRTANRYMNKKSISNLLPSLNKAKDTGSEISSTEVSEPKTKKPKFTELFTEISSPMIVKGPSVRDFQNMQRQRLPKIESLEHAKQQQARAKAKEYPVVEKENAPKLIAKTPEHSFYHSEKELNPGELQSIDNAVQAKVPHFGSWVRNKREQEQNNPEMVPVQPNVPGKPVGDNGMGESRRAGNEWNERFNQRNASNGLRPLQVNQSPDPQNMNDPASYMQRVSPRPDQSFGQREIPDMAGTVTTKPNFPQEIPEMNQKKPGYFGKAADGMQAVNMRDPKQYLQAIQGPPPTQGPARNPNQQEARTGPAALTVNRDIQRKPPETLTNQTQRQPVQQQLPPGVNAPPVNMQARQALQGLAGMQSPTDNDYYESYQVGREPQPGQQQKLDTAMQGDPRQLQSFVNQKQEQAKPQNKYNLANLSNLSTQNAEDDYDSYEVSHNKPNSQLQRHNEDQDWWKQETQPYRSNVDMVQGKQSPKRRASQLARLASLMYRSNASDQLDVIKGPVDPYEATAVGPRPTPVRPEPIKTMPGKLAAGGSNGGDGNGPSNLPVGPQVHEAVQDFHQTRPQINATHRMSEGLVNDATRQGINPRFAAKQGRDMFDFLTTKPQLGNPNPLNPHEFNNAGPVKYTPANKPQPNSNILNMLDQEQDGPFAQENTQGSYPLNPKDFKRL